MAHSIINLARLAKAGFVLAQHGVRLVPDGLKLPPPVKLALAATWPIRVLSAPFHWGKKPTARIASALNSLGPSYIKLGQFLGTRADIIGPRLASELSQLQDRMPPFSMAEANRAVEDALGGRLTDHYAAFSAPIAAASIAQVHKAETRDSGLSRTVAVKILRPGVERRFKADLDSYYFAATQIERFYAPSRRLRPIAVVDNLKRTTELELDLRLEAAAISEMADNIRGDKPRPGEGAGFRVPTVDWRRTQKRVLTIEWIDGIPISDHDQLKARGFDLKALGLTVLRAFLTHAMRDGFFHADMHQGNLLVDAEGRVVAVDFGIVGRLGPRERRFLAEILHGLITRDYRRAAAIHFEAGYVPPHHSIDVFAQAMRAIGEPIHGRTANEISMADLLGQLFAYTEVFDMETRPELILLQKSMVIVEGVARSLDPSLNLWSAAEPIAKEWMETNLGVAGRLREAGEGASELAKVLGEAPVLLAQAERMVVAIATMARDGVRVDANTMQRIADTDERQNRWSTRALWLGAASLAAIAARQIGWI
ncbi:MAG: 2-polyprenylphenol 6-hydroxylase [Hyphomicrobium sp.]|nr:2-polyprenylphenol 6-hydroxylase [Hyphomicrobium sp.]PPC80142.1 MAG: 2-polyprenylphenol 6-hydroxylase [Hyphomicrobium sp.]